MAFAFEVPDHLPRSGKISDTSTSILTKVGSHQSLSADLTTSWLTELDSAIRDTKSCISKRMQDDLVTFELQSRSSLTIKMQLEDLSGKVNNLDQFIHDSNSGIQPILLRTLSAHAMVANNASDSEVTYQTLAHLLRIQEELGVLSASVKQGKLAEAAEASSRMHTLVIEAPSPLDRSEIMAEIKKKYRTLHDLVQEQLGDAYTQSIMFSDPDGTVTVTVFASTKVPSTLTDIVLSEILRSLTSDALSTRLSVLRRDIMVKFVEPILLSSVSVKSSSNDVSSMLTLAPSSPSFQPLRSLATLSSFLNSNLFFHLPSTHTTSPNILHTLITTAILTHLVKPSIPSSLSSLPSFLDTVDEAVRFEQALLPIDARDRSIQRWAADVAGHYEKKRREDVMQHARQVIMKHEDDIIIKMEVKESRESSLRLSESQEDIDQSEWNLDAKEGRVGISRVETNASPQNAGESTKNLEDASDSWGWGDESDGDLEPVLSGLPSYAKHPTKAPREDAEDDPWGVDGWDVQPTPVDQPVTASQETSPQHPPKLAKRLEKFSAKGKGHSFSNPSFAISGRATAPKPVSLSPQSLVPLQRRPVQERATRAETYLISLRAKTSLEMAESLLHEGRELMRSNMLSGRGSGSAKPGQLLMEAGPLVLDLHRALYPVTHSSTLAHDQDIAMRWSNDCSFLSGEAANISNSGQVWFAQEKWAETSERLKTLGDAWLEDVVARQQDEIKNILAGAQGFVEVADAERYEEYRFTIQQILEEITIVAHRWRATLTRTAYLYALGKVIEDSLLRFMTDVLSLADIPAADAERLGELCEMLVLLEELFVGVPGEQSVVGGYVSSWFKFSYLSWLLKGSIADLVYLFDQGMLVDYEIDELIRLLRALFAETPLRENTIAKISGGHPAVVGRGY